MTAASITYTKTAENNHWDFYFMLIAGDGIKSYYDIIFKDKYFILDYFDTKYYRQIRRLDYVP